MSGTGAALPLRVVAAAGALSCVAATIHLLVAPEHLEEWWGYGAFFVVAAVGEMAFFLLLLNRPSGAVVQVGIWGSLATVLMYLVSRTGGIPLGPAAGVVEDVEPFGIAATLAEATLVVLLCTVLRGPARRRTLDALALVGVLLWIGASSGALTPSPQAAGAGGHHHDHGAADGQDAQPLPFIPELLREAARPAPDR